MCQCNVVSKLYPSFPKLCQSCRKVVSKLTLYCSKLCQSCPESVYKLSLVSNLSKSCPKVVAKGYQSCPTVVSKLSKSAYYALCMWCQVVSSGAHELRLPCGHDGVRAFDLADILLGKRSCQYIKPNVPCCF